MVALEIVTRTLDMHQHVKREDPNHTYLVWVGLIVCFILAYFGFLWYLKKRTERQRARQLPTRPFYFHYDAPLPTRPISQFSVLPDLTRPAATYSRPEAGSNGDGIHANGSARPPSYAAHRFFDDDAPRHIPWPK